MITGTQNKKGIRWVPFAISVDRSSARGIRSSARTAPFRPVEFWRKETDAMVPLMLFAAAMALLPALLQSPNSLPIPLTREEEDVQAARERAQRPLRAQ